MDSPVVSVLMTAYNRSKYIANAIESVLASDYERFELIVVDDGSTDDTVAIAKNYAAKDPRVLVFQNEKNLGDYPNRNKAASHAKGKYLKYVDSDDFIYPWGLRLLVSMMEDAPEAGFGICSLAPDDAKPFPFLLQPKEAYRYHYFGPGLFHRAPLSAIIRKDAFDNVGGFRDIRMAGDYEMWHRMAQEFPVLLMPQGIVWDRKHGDQEISVYKKFLAVYESIKFSYLSDTKCPLDKTEVAKLIKKGKGQIRKDLVKAGISFNLSRVKDALQRARKYSKIKPV